jgi:hypothetical protein
MEMTADEIRDSFSHNAVYSLGYSGFDAEDMKQLMRIQILAMGELAAQLAEYNERKPGGGRQREPKP